MRTEGHLAPFRFLAGSFNGTGAGSATLLMPADTQGIITDIKLVMQTYSAAVTCSIIDTFADQFVIGVQEVLSGGPTQFHVINPEGVGLFIPVYGGEQVKVDMVGFDSGTNCWYQVSGYLYSVQAQH